MSAPLDKIITTLPGRIAQLEGGVGNNNFSRASEVNPIIDYLNNRSMTNAATVTAGGTTTACTATINAAAGYFTTVAMTAATTVSVTVTVTNSTVTASSLILVQMTGFSGTVVTDGIPMVFTVVPSAGSFVINITNIGANTMTTKSMDFKFVVL